MPLSHYLKVFPDPDDPAFRRVFSTRRGSLTRLPAELLARLESAHGEWPPDLPADAAETLKRVAVWVDDLQAERAEVLGYLDEVNRVSLVFTAAVILGMGCNFACPYCYEGSEHGNAAMTPETAEDTSAYLLGHLGPRRKRLLVDFYGGEPLLYRPRLVQLARALGAGCEARGVRFGFTLVTNGSLLTPAVLDELLPLGLTGAKVTLDGPPDVHDRSRPRRGGRGTFAAILANLSATTDRVALGVGGNFSRDTWRRFPELLDRLQEAGLGPDRLARVQFSPVIATGGELACAGCGSTGEPWLAEAAATLHREVGRRGYRTAKITPTPCMADLDHAITVNWDGTLTRCPGLINRPEFVVGTLATGITAAPDPFRVPRWQDRAECRDCRWLPLCFGGCRFLQLQRTGSIAGVDCMAAFWEAGLGRMVG